MITTLPVRPRHRQGTVSTLGGPIVPRLDMGGIDPHKLFAHDPTAAHTVRDLHRREGLPAPDRAIRATMLALALLDLGIAVGEVEPPRLRWINGPHYVEARAWIISREWRWPFAFVPICEALGLDAGQIRAAVLARCPLVTA